MKAIVLRSACAAVLVAVVVVDHAHAQSYPTRPVRLIIPFSAGGAADVPGRILADRLSTVLGQQVVARTLGVTSARRSRELPQVPTIAEAGVKG